MSSTAGRRYEITHFRKENLLRLRKFMNEVLIDQLPMLTDMHRALEEMAIRGETSLSGNNAFIVEALPELRTRIMKGKDFKKIAAMQAITFFAKNTQQAKEDMDRMLKLYTDDVYEDFMEDPLCQVCGTIATQRCSRCKNVWYCSRECQLKQWKEHKAMCDVFSTTRTEAEKEKDAEKAAMKKA